MSGFRLAIGVDCASSGVDSSPRRGFLVGRVGCSSVSEGGAGFLIKGDLKGLKTMIVLVFLPFLVRLRRDEDATKAPDAWSRVCL
jgi:hypothetical protein